MVDRTFLLTAFFSVLVTGAGARQTDTLKKDVKILPVPSFGYSPETQTYIGAVALFTLDFYHDSSTRTSNTKAEFNYTWRRQMIIEAGWNYFFKAEKWYTQGLIHYSKYPDFYYGIGDNTPKNAEVLYQSKRNTIDINFLRKFGHKIFIGPRVRYSSYYGLNYEKSVLYPELRDASIWGGGFTILKDTRNNLLNSTTGWYAELTNTYNSFGNHTYAKVISDGRRYLRITGNSIVAIRLYNEFTFGDPPFFDYALTGGDKRVRGYYYGRYRDKNLSTVQAEYRFKVIWRFGAAVFGGITKLYPEARLLSFTNFQPNYGGGIRFLIDRKQNINLRFDYAMGMDHQSGFYVSFGESF